MIGIVNDFFFTLLHMVGLSAEGFRCLKLWASCIVYLAEHLQILASIVYCVTSPLEISILVLQFYY